MVTNEIGKISVHSDSDFGKLPASNVPLLRALRAGYDDVLPADFVLADQGIFAQFGI